MNLQIEGPYYTFKFFINNKLELIPKHMPYLSNSGLLKVQKLKTYVFTPHDLNTQEIRTLVYHEIS
jgi:hypothetical protein